MSKISIARAVKIIDNQLKSYAKNPSVDGLTFIYNPENVTKIKFTIKCPDDSFWHDQTLTGDIDVPNNYPFSPPTVHFTCNLYHPNIYSDGKVCISILNETQDQFKYFKLEELWSPAIDLTTIIVSIWNVLLEPNIESPANVDAMKDYRDNLPLFIEKTRDRLTQH